MQRSHGRHSENSSPENVEELMNKINSSQEEFLSEDDPQLKADAFRHLSGYARQFVDLVPHDEKFRFPETERVLRRSSMNITDFDPHEGSMAFEHLAKYAHNLYDQPWRTDFLTLKVTSGFFVHNISSQLDNAQDVLITMGYEAVDNNTLKALQNFDPHRIKAVSKDMIIASQECIVLSQIWQRVAGHEPDYPLTIGEVFEFRSNHLGDVDTICKILLSDIHRRHKKVHLPNSIQDFQQLEAQRKFKDDDERMETDVTDSCELQKEVYIVENVLKNTRTLHDPVPVDEHIYDPVYKSPVSNVQYSESQNSYDHQYTPYSTRENLAVGQNLKTSSQHYRLSHSNYGTKVADFASPLIPKIGPNLGSYPNPRQRHSCGPTISSSSSVSGISGRSSRCSVSTNKPLQFSKVSLEETCKLYSPKIPARNSEEDLKLNSDCAMKTAANQSKETVIEIQCPQCTLLNSLKNDICDACGFHFMP